MKVHRTHILKHILAWFVVRKLERQASRMLALSHAHKRDFSSLTGRKTVTFFLLMCKLLFVFQRLVSGQKLALASIRF